MNGYAKLSDLVSEADSRPLAALCIAVASARSEEGCAMVDGSFWWTVDNVTASRREWAWALVYFLEWVRRGR